MLKNVQNLINHADDGSDNESVASIDMEHTQLVMARPRLNIDQVIDAVNQQTQSQAQSDVGEGSHETDEEMAVRLAREMANEIDDDQELIPARRELVNLNDESPICREFREGEFEEWLEWLHPHGVTHWGTRDLSVLLNEFYQIKADRKPCLCGKTRTELDLAC